MVINDKFMIVRDCNFTCLPWERQTWGPCQQRLARQSTPRRLSPGWTGESGPRWRVRSSCSLCVSLCNDWRVAWLCQCNSLHRSTLFSMMRSLLTSLQPLVDDLQSLLFLLRFFIFRQGRFGPGTLPFHWALQTIRKAKSRNRNVEKQCRGCTSTNLQAR